MALFDRDSWERRLAREAARLGQQALDDLTAVLGDPPDFASIPASFWDDATATMAAGVTPILRDAYMASAEAALAESVVGVDWAVVNQQARLEFYGYPAGYLENYRDNIARVTPQAMAGILGGLQSLHTDGYDEVFSTPTAEAARIAARATERAQRGSSDAAAVPMPDTVRAKIQALLGRYKPQGTDEGKALIKRDQAPG